MNAEIPATHVFGFEIGIVALLSGLQRFFTDLVS